MQVFNTAEPSFPLSQPPNCRACGAPGDLISAARRSNPIGNAGRPYYICSRGGHRANTWITFDDSQGIMRGNPTCYCGHTSRLSRRRDGDGQFYCCPVGRCDYQRNGPTDTNDAHAPAELDGHWDPMDLD